MLTLRTGVEESSVHVSERATTIDVVEALSQECGPQVRPALLKGDRLRSDTVAVRESSETPQRLTSDSHVEPGDTLRFQFEDPDQQLYA
ncbi:hypothetical protein [Halocatena pleomorpha]|uniref:hypothetical protein n=1 Tax=Halocatena pleomorpha TaxID=1785090 RepID=UPI000F611F84|nr:hypothetical protein [Halocatena pleomorpha]